MQILVLCHNKDQAKFIQKGLFYENLGSLHCEIPPDKKIPLRHLSSDAFLILSRDPKVDMPLIDDIRRQRTSAAIILLAENPYDNIESEAKQAGANLIFIRPFSFSDMAIQIKYLVYVIKKPATSKILCAGSLELDANKRVLLKSGRLISLRNKEFSLLEFLMLNKNRVLTRTEIFESVWDRNGDIATNTVDVHISNLRKKISISPGNGLIRTINCIGYFFEVE